MEPYRTSAKMSDYLEDHLESVPLDGAEKLLVDCKIIGVEFVTEDISPDSQAVDILLYLERPDGSRFQLDCSARAWNKKWEWYDDAHLLVSKAEFSKEVM